MARSNYVWSPQSAPVRPARIKMDKIVPTTKPSDVSRESLRSARRSRSARFGGAQE